VIELSQSLSGIRVLEFSHAVMGPACGLILADLGAEVIKVEPADGGDPTRNLTGFGSGFFTFYNRNKKSIAIDLKSESGIAAIYQLIEKSDVVIENFAPGTMDRLGLGYEQLCKVNPRLVYCGLKGFLDGPYENRMALDEVIQMMTGLAYMTGPVGKPMRAGASVLDILTGTFGVIAIQAALREREKTGKGGLIKAGLFETGAFLMGQHLAYAAIQGGPIPTMSERVSAWSIYDMFTAEDGEQVFIGITSDRQWERFCQSFKRADLLSDARLNTNNARVAARPWLIKDLREMLSSMQSQEVMCLCERARIPYAKVNSPDALFNDAHLSEGGHFIAVELPDGRISDLPGLPISSQEKSATGLYRPPKFGQHNDLILDETKKPDSE
jgi:crotonobetainyl-CoA:carnitine CoA-transferase CaiB-like acyl-CoA transferase